MKIESLLLHKINKGIFQLFHQSAFENFDAVFNGVKKRVGNSENMIDEMKVHKTLLGFSSLNEILQYYLKDVPILHMFETADRWILTRELSP